MSQQTTAIARAALRGWLDSIRRLREHPLVDPTSPPFTSIAVPMFVGILSASVGLLAYVADGGSIARPEVWLLLAAIIVTENAEIHVAPHRNLVLNDLFYLVPFAVFPAADAAALVLLALGADTLIHPRPLVRWLARQSSGALMRLLGLLAVLATRELLAGADLGQVAETTLLVIAGMLGTRFNDYVVFPVTVRLAVGPEFSYREFVTSSAMLDRFVIALEVPMALVAAYAYDIAPASSVLLVAPYLALWRLGRLRPRVAQLEAADRVKSEFLAMASHELRTPLTSIQGFATTLQMRWPHLSEQDKLDFIDVIAEQGERLGRLVDDLLTMSRIEAGNLATHVQPTPLHDLASRTVDQFGGRASARIPDDLHVLADPDHVEQIIVNYVGNAIKYGEEPITVEAEAVGEWVELRVRDSGAGVPKEFVPQLFERFTQASDPTRRRSSGTGLGLSIVRALAAAQEGEAWYEPNEPTGAVFAVRLRRA